MLPYSTELIDNKLHFCVTIKNVTYKNPVVEMRFYYIYMLIKKLPAMHIPGAAALYQECQLPGYKCPGDQA